MDLLILPSNDEKVQKEEEQINIADFILQEDPLADHVLDIIVNHDFIELRMMEVSQEANLKFFGFSVFFLITNEEPCPIFF